MPERYFAQQSAAADPNFHFHSAQELFEHSLDLLCVAGLDGYFKKVNPSWTRVLGWTETELLARPSIEFVHPEDADSTIQKRELLAAGEAGIRIENRYRCKDGSFRWLAWQSVVSRDNDTIFGVARDVTEQHQAEQLRQTTTRLESTALFAGGIAHDFNNLLTTLQLSLELAQLGGPLTSNQATNLKQAQDAVLSARALTQLLLSLSAGSNQPRSPLDAAALLHQARDQIHPTGHAVEFEFPPTLPTVRADAGQLLLAFKQVLLNALEASPSGATVRIRAEVRDLAADAPSALPVGRYLQITVIDTGRGIAPAHLPRIFDPYFTTKPLGGQKGMGLGLAICHNVLRKHHGAITVDSRPGAGTSAHLFLPLHNADSGGDPDR